MRSMTYPSSFKSAGNTGSSGRPDQRRRNIFGFLVQQISLQDWELMMLWVSDMVRKEKSRKVMWLPQEVESLLLKM